MRSGTSGTPVVFLHGFGASAYHWRYNIPVLAEKHRVFAMDLLGMGWSDKPTGENIYQVWPRQIAAFIKEVGMLKSLSAFCVNYIELRLVNDLQNLLVEASFT